MKRSGSHLEAPASRRQEPVSCQFCRAKKLRCSREWPCSNCRARNIDCLSALAVQRLAKSGLPSPGDDAAPEPLSLESLHKRTQRIERALGLPPDQASSPQSTSIGSKTRAFNAPPPSEPSHHASGVLDASMSETARRLESAAIGHHSEDLERRRVKLYPQPDRSAFNMGIRTSQLLQIWPSNPENILTSSNWSALLPPYVEAVHLLEFYAKHVSWAYHVLHLPTLRHQLDQVYQQLSCGSTPEPSLLALLCAVFALSKYFTDSPPTAGTEAPPSNERGYLEFVSLTSQALAEAKHLDTPTIESIQAVLLLANSLLLSIGAVPPARVLLTSAAFSAQLLGIHKVDSPKNRRLRQGGNHDQILLETKRRVWWLIASTDWLNCPNGTYSLQPNQMHVDLPSNADDAAITREHCPQLPPTDITEMTYFISRCRLSVTWREFVDVANASGVEMDEVDYDQVLVVDKKMNEFIDTMTGMFDAEPGDHERYKLLERQRPYVVWQQYMGHLSVHARLARIHRPYLARGAHDPRYAYSRMVCLRSARKVLEFERQMRAEMTPSLQSHKFWVAMYQVFLATVVLLMDFNFNKSEPHTKERMDEIMECCRTLEAAAGVSNIAARGLEELKDTMRKWGLLTDVAPKACHNEERQGTAEPPPSVSQVVESDSVYPQAQAEMTQGDDFSNSWINSWDFGLDLDHSQWNGLFYDLHNRVGAGF